jgi:hypothetical protein
MKKFFLIIVVLVTCIYVKSQTKALTDDGREVILYENGTWKYAHDSSSKTLVNPDSLATNPHGFGKSAGSSFLVKSRVMNAGVYINPAKWIFMAHRENEINPEYRFSMKSSEGYAMLITEKIPIGFEGIREAALINAQKVSNDAKETSAEFRIVNGKKILCLKIQGTIKTIKFVYLGYYFSNDNGTVQLIAYTGQQYFSHLQSEMESFLNGLVELK